MDLQFIKEGDLSDIPSILYKYRTWQNVKHKRLLTHGEIHFAAPNEFNEVTECNLDRDYDCITEDMIWEFCKNEAMRQVNYGEIPISSVNNKAKELYETNLFHDERNRKETKVFMDARLNKTLSIFCATESAVNERLWRVFAAQNSGYCVGIDFTEIYKDSATFGSCSPVHYYDENNPPKIPALSLNPDEQVLNMLKIIYSLPKKFEQEQEFRLSKVNITNRTVKIKSDWIKEVIIGSEMPTKDEEEIVDIVRGKYPNAKMKRLFVEPTFNAFSIVDY